MRVFDRLIGLETEYALRSPSPASPDTPTHYDLYERLIEALRQKLPTAVASVQAQGKPGIFLATGGAVWFERYRLSLLTGLIEGSTPECRGPRQLIACQRAQDRLLAEAARDSADGAFCLIKNCRDSQGNSYGAQENYEAVVAKGWRLLAWRAGWFLILPMAILTFVLLIALCLFVMAANFLIAGPLFLLLVAFTNPSEYRQKQWKIRLFGRQTVTNNEADAPWPGWLEGVLFFFIKVLVTPIFLAMCALLSFTDFRRTQRRMVGFLVSRSVIAGAGWLDKRGRFHLAEKAETRGVLWHEAIPEFSRPVFNLAHFFKMLFAIPPRFRDLLGARQRLQISLGDSNLCEEAEYLRVATTLLVIDAAEAGALENAPVVRRPMSAIRAISRDPTLAAGVGVWGYDQMTALELQRWYLDACRWFVLGQPDAPEEAREVLRLWEDVLDRLETDRDSLVGRLDWVTKRFLLEEAGAGLSHASRKKIDLRYHELSEAGYFARLRSAGQSPAVVSDEEVERAMRFPPPSSPAVRRARYIREFSGTNTLLKVSWRLIEVIRNGVTETKIDLRDPWQ